MPHPPVERRKVQRVKLTRPLHGKSGSSPIYLVDASVEGIRIAHQGIVSAVGKTLRVEFAWEGQRIELECAVVHNTLIRLAKSKKGKSTYHAGLRIIEAVGDSRAVLRQLVADCVARALDEQKANARGIPAEVAQVFQTGKGTEYLRCELIEGAWRRTSTMMPDQPANGFTVSANEDRAQIEVLCRTFETSDSAGRRMIRTMAKMSISRAEGVPTRRYSPS